MEWYNSHAQEQAELTGDLAAGWSKLEGYAPRLALVIHLVRAAADDPTIDSADRVDEASVRAGCTLSDWFGHEARRVYGVLGESDEDREDRRLVELIQAGAAGSQPANYAKPIAAFATALMPLRPPWKRWSRPVSAPGRQPLATNRGADRLRIFPSSTVSTVNETQGTLAESMGCVDVDNVDTPESEVQEWMG